MLESTVIRLVALTVTVAAIVGASSTAADAAGPKRLNFKAGLASCFIPNNVYGGEGPTITAPSVRYRNARKSSVRVRAWAIVVNETTGKRISYRRIGDRKLARRRSTAFPSITLPLPERSTSSYYAVGVRVQLEVRYRGSLIEIYTGIPSAYDTYTNGGYFHTYTGRASVC